MGSWFKWTLWTFSLAILFCGIYCYTSSYEKSNIKPEEMPVFAQKLVEFKPIISAVMGILLILAAFSAYCREFLNKIMANVKNNYTSHYSHYSVIHILQHGSLDGKDGKQEVKPEQLNDAFWDYVLLDSGPFDSNTIHVPEPIAKRCRRESGFWRAPDVRVSGKNLLTNHLTFYVFNQVAIFGNNDDKWPKGIRANGHLMLNNEKMSKSTGNFMTLAEAVDQVSADGMRLADAGDGVEDANFATQTADKRLLRLHLLIENVKEWLKRKSEGGYQSGERNAVDQYFVNRFHQLAFETFKSYEATEYKNALKFGLYEFQLARDTYHQMCGGTKEQMHVDLVDLYTETQARLMAPICPHVMEHIWQLLGKKMLLVNEKWPQVEALQLVLLTELDFVLETTKRLRTKLEEQKRTKGKKSGDKNAKPKRATIYIAKTYPSWQAEVVGRLNDLVTTSDLSAFPESRMIAEDLKSTEAMKKHGKKVMSFVQLIKEEFTRRGTPALENSCSVEQRSVLESILDYVRHATEVERTQFVDVHRAGTSGGEFAEKAAPFKPWI